MLPRIAIIDNLSAYSYRLTPPGFLALTTFGVPSETAAWMAAGACDAALVPAAALPSLDALAQPLGAYGIACEGAVSSVLLFTRTSLRHILQQGLPVYVTPQSCTSRRLLTTLCLLQYGIAPQLADTPHQTAARLLIGDEASNRAREEHAWPGVYDLSQWWYQVTGWPFVFARWVARRDLPQAKRLLLADWLEQSAQRAQTSQGREKMAAAAAARGLLHGSELFALGYYRRLHVRLTLRDLRGLTTFLMLQEEDA